MTQKKHNGFWANLLGLPPPRDKYSIEELRHLHDVLRSNSEVTDQNKSSVVEALRAIAELMIWGDQHDTRFFDFFLENNLMRHFTAFLEKPANRKGEVAKQVIKVI
jgi:protein CLEC16A